MDQLSALMSNAKVAGAIRYALERWDGLTVCLEDGRVELDSNAVERMIKPIVLTRKNSLFAGHDEGASYYPSVYLLKIQSYFGLRRKNAVAGAIVGGRRRCTRLVA
jgi:hypothetical protein